ncbi:MAG: alpha/beta hydrolase [Bdellovibrionaceae bacterium]|nr:alpha/beta hydrolase [Pseudobdellovibrionaceae bacterium]
MKEVWGFLLCCALGLAGAAAPLDVVHASPEPSESGFIQIGHHRSLWVNYEKPAPGKPVIVLVNGLTYKASSWESFAQGLRGEGFGILRFDPMGHGRTLLKHAPQREPLPIEGQLRDMRKLFEVLGLHSRPIHLVGLSYGGGLASLYTSRYPEHIANCIVMAPFTEPIPQQHNWILAQVRSARLMNPLNPLSDEQMYDVFLRNLIYATYPIAEPTILENPFRLEATFRLVQGIRHYRFDDIADKLPSEKFHLVIARRDELVPAKLLEKAWEETPPHTRRSRIFIEESRHRIPTHIPRFSSAVVKAIVRGHSAFNQGRTLVAVPSEGVVRVGNKVVLRDLPKE